jgi:hypothetical protein
MQPPRRLAARGLFRGFLRPGREKPSDEIAEVFALLNALVPTSLTAGNGESVPDPASLQEDRAGQKKKLSGNGCDS